MTSPRNMYRRLPKESSNNIPTNPTTPEAPKVIPPANKRLSGLKLTNSHMHEVEIDGRTVTIPSAAYVKLLEDQIKDFRQKLIEYKSNISSLRSEIMTLKNTVNRLQTNANYGKFK